MHVQECTLNCTVRTSTGYNASMFRSNKNTIILGVTEARTRLPELLKDLGKKKIVLVKRGYPVGVIQAYQEFVEREELLGRFF